MKWVGAFASLTLIVCATADAHAEREAAATNIDAAGAHGLLAPFAIGVPVARSPIAVRLEGGYDQAARRPIADVHADVRVWRWVRVLAGAERGAGEEGALRPTLGVAAVLADRETWGAAASVAYRPEGFTEPEGEIELKLTGARRIAGLTLSAMIAYGQDPEARERDGEQGLAVTAPVSRSWWLGVGERARASLAAPEPGVPAWDVAGGPVVATEVGPVLVTAMIGASAVSLDDDVRVGATGSISVLRVF
jgi:hypothetical protein